MEHNNSNNNEGNGIEAIQQMAKTLVSKREQSESGKQSSLLTRDERKYISKAGMDLKSKYHSIHGKYYDLELFMKESKHPGGSDILLMTRGLVDSTPLFESYHAMGNRDSILSQLEKYRVISDADNGVKEEKPHGMFSFDEKGFYRTVTKRVRQYFIEKNGKEKDDGKSLTHLTKADKWWIMKVSLQFIASLTFYYFAFLSTKIPTIQIAIPRSADNEVGKFNQTIIDENNRLHSEERINDMIYAFISGCFFIQWGFTVMHDGSHFAIAPRNHWVNTVLTKIWCSFLLWSSKIWILHHCVLHHSFTGNSLLDPDERHAMPFIRKHPDTPKQAVSTLFGRIGEYFGFIGYGIAAIVLYFFLPGMWLGQVLQYLAFTLALSNWKYLWGMIYPDHKAYSIQWYELVLPLLQVSSHIFRGDPYVSFAFVVSLNFFYATSIVGDHDTVDAAIINHADFSLKPESTNENNSNANESKEVKKDEVDNYEWGTLDWGEMQVRNSSNFVNHYLFDMFAACFGSINYQIEHHLFPGVSHIHLPHIAPIVKATCEEFKVPYTSYPSLFSVFVSFLKTIDALSISGSKKGSDKKVE